jgi:FkbM family methyltransferase
MFNRLPLGLVGLLRRKLRSRPDPFLRHCRGIVHVGANDGQEREIYNDYGLRVVWVEAIPDVYELLIKNIEPYVKQIAINALLTDAIGEKVKFYIANNNGASSSIFDLALHKDIWPEVDYVRSIELETDTLDNLLSSRRVDQSEIDALVLDTQGSELLVLKGSERLLHRISYVKVEAADFEAYKGGATVESLKQFLKGFSLVLAGKNEFAQHPQCGKYYDLLFKRQASANRSDDQGCGSPIAG